MRTQIRKIGNSAGAIIPAAILKSMNLNEGDDIRISQEGETILIEPLREKPKYTLDDLLAQCDDQAPMPEELQEWDQLPSKGKEEW